MLCGADFVPSKWDKLGVCRGGWNSLLGGENCVFLSFLVIVIDGMSGWDDERGILIERICDVEDERRESWRVALNTVSLTILPVSVLFRFGGAMGAVPW